MPDIDRALHRSDQSHRCGHGDIDTPRLGEEPVVAGVVDPRDHPVDAEFGLGEKRHGEVGLVVAGGGDGDVADVYLGLLQG